MNNQTSTIKDNLKDKTNDELFEILKCPNYNNWSFEAFKAANEILDERGVEVPIELQVGQKPEEKKIDIFRKTYRFFKNLGKIIGTLVAILTVITIFKNHEYLQITNFVELVIRILQTIFPVAVFYYSSLGFIIVLWVVFIKLAKISSDQCIMCLSEAENDDLIRRIALKKLISKRKISSDALSVLIDILVDRQIKSKQKRLALIAIGKMDHQEINHAWNILPLINDKDSIISKEAQKLLEEMTGQNFGEDLDRWKQFLLDSNIENNSVNTSSKIKTGNDDIQNITTDKQVVDRKEIIKIFENSTDTKQKSGNNVKSEKIHTFQDVMLLSAGIGVKEYVGDIIIYHDKITFESKYKRASSSLPEIELEIERKDIKKIYTRFMSLIISTKSIKYKFSLDTLKI